MNKPDALWDQYFQYLLDLEGRSFENDPADPGGRTKFGIDQRAHPDIDIRQLTEEKASEIYLKEYWESFASKLPSPVNYVVFTFVVNAGERAAVKVMQRAAGAETVDGIFGPLTQGDINQYYTDYGPKGLIEKFVVCTEVYYRGLDKPRFIRGWLNRARGIKEWAKASMGPKWT